MCFCICLYVCVCCCLSVVKCQTRISKLKILELQEHQYSYTPLQDTAISPSDGIISIHNPCSCQIEAFEFTDTVRQRGLDRSLWYERGDGYFFLHNCFI